jgi:uncharacterized DUF497 family protein
MIRFEWDVAKARTNLAKHNVAFEESCMVFADVNSLTIDDPQHSQSEKRSITLGLASTSRLLVVVLTERNGKIRIISARRASKKEKEQYEKK